MTIVHHASKTRRWPMPCCGLADHNAILADIEQDALSDPDLARLLPRVRYLLAGHTTEPVGPWWAR